MHRRYLNSQTQVTLIQVAEEHLRKQATKWQTQIMDWLFSRDIVAQTKFIPINHGSDANQLDAALTDIDCDAVIAGADGHRRMRETAFGGVTRNVLLGGSRWTLLSH